LKAGSEHLGEIKMLILNIKLSHRREARKTGDFHPVQPLLEKTLEINYHGPEDSPLVASNMMEMFRIFKNLVVQLLRVPI